MKKINLWLFVYLTGLFLVAGCGKTRSGSTGKKEKTDNIPVYVQKNYKKMIAGYDTLKSNMPKGMQILVLDIQHHYNEMVHGKLSLNRSGNKKSVRGKRMSKKEYMRDPFLIEMNQEMMAMNYGLQRVREMNSMRSMMGGEMMFGASNTDTSNISSVYNVGNGVVLFHNYCASCHGYAGQGVSGVFPPVNNSSIVSGDKANLIKILLDGLQGDISVQRNHYNSIMPAFGARFSDAQIADILSTLRAMPENHSGKITENEVKKVRDRVQGRSKPWMPQDLGLSGN